MLVSARSCCHVASWSQASWTQRSRQMHDYFGDRTEARWSLLRRYCNAGRECLWAYGQQLDLCSGMLGQWSHPRCDTFELLWWFSPESRCSAFIWWLWKPQRWWMQYSVNVLGCQRKCLGIFVWVVSVYLLRGKKKHTIWHWNTIKKKINKNFFFLPKC